MRANPLRLFVVLTAASVVGTAACDVDLFENIDPWAMEYHLRVGLTVEGTLPDTIRWTASVFRIAGADTTAAGNPQVVAPMHAARYDFGLLEWDDTDTALICFDVDDPCSVVGDTAQTTQLSVGEMTEVYFRILCP
jgi:hypothetical protein